MESETAGGIAYRISWSLEGPEHNLFRGQEAILSAGAMNWQLRKHRLC